MFLKTNRNQNLRFVSSYPQTNIWEIIHRTDRHETRWVEKLWMACIWSNGGWSGVASGENPWMSEWKEKSVSSLAEFSIKYGRPFCHLECSTGIGSFMIQPQFWRFLYKFSGEIGFRNMLSRFDSVFFESDGVSLVDQWSELFRER